MAPRRIPVGAPPIPTATTPADLQSVKDGIRRHEHLLSGNHGVAGPAFIDQLVREIADGSERLLSRHRELTRACQGTSDWTARRAPHVAALALAAELAEQWGIVPYPRPPWSLWEAVLCLTRPWRVRTRRPGR